MQAVPAAVTMTAFGSSPIIVCALLAAGWALWYTVLSLWM
jgi:hypothetical protein